MVEVLKMTLQLATRIDARIKKTLDRLHKKTHIPIRQLTEKAITLLEEYYMHLQESYKGSTVDNNFVSLLEHSMKTHDKTYEKLAK